MAKGISAGRIIFVLLTFITVGTILCALFQLAFIQRLEESSGLRRRANEEGTDILRTEFVKSEIISWSPIIIVFRNFMSEKECDYIRELAEPRLEASSVIDRNTGKSVKNEVRTSYGMWLNPEEWKHPIVQAIEKRIAVYSRVPIEHGEPMHVLRYEKKQYYMPHYDYFGKHLDKYQPGGQRIATMLMYLNDNVEGGETYFPEAGNENCSCGGETAVGISVKPIKGDAVLFWGVGFDGKSDPKSLHGGCDVLEGVKWTATKWLTQKPYHLYVEDDYLKEHNITIDP